MIPYCGLFVLWLLVTMVDNPRGLTPPDLQSMSLSSGWYGLPGAFYSCEVSASGAVQYTMGDAGNLPPHGAPRKLQPLGSQPQKCPHRKTDFRYELWLKERKLLRAKARKNSFRVDSGNVQPRLGMVTVDTSKSRSSADVVRLCLRELGWREFPYGKRDGGHCDIYWNSVHFSDQPDIPAGRVNKFPGMVETVRKVNLGRILDILRGLFPKDYDFHPESWFLPQQYGEFCDAVRHQHVKKNRPIYIVKPDEGSQGEGIYLIHEPKEYVFNHKYHVVQEYLAEPLLLENLKFDFRVYVVLTSLEPLEIYLYKEGLARFCTVPYQFPSNKNIHDAYMHLTNYSLNKRSATYLHTESEDDGSKRTMRSVFRKLASMGYDTTQLWEDIRCLVVKTILAMVPLLKVEYRAEIPQGKPGPSCFQILGFDVIIMDNLKPMLLEVNANPSLRLDFDHEVAPGIVEHVHSPVDEEVKRPLVFDTLLLMAPRHKARARRRQRSSSRESSGKENDLSRTGSDGATDDSDGDYDTKVIKGYTSMEQVYPAKFEERYEHLRILERTVEVFLYCLGIRGALRMGPTGFRTFTRKCKLTASLTGLTNAALDIMYIDLQRRWEFMNPDNRTSGLCYQGFLEAFFLISKKKFSGSSALESVQELLDYCEDHLDFGDDHKPQSGYLPRITKKDKRLDELKSLYGMANRKSRGSSFFLDYKNFSVEKSKAKKSESRTRTKRVKDE